MRGPMKKIATIILAAGALCGCSSLGAGESGFSDYALVRVKRVSVGDGSMNVMPPQPYNRHRGHSRG